MQLPAHRVGFHADADQVIGTKHLERLFFRERHAMVLLYVVAPADEHEQGLTGCSMHGAGFRI